MIQNNQKKKRTAITLKIKSMMFYIYIFLTGVMRSVCLLGSSIHIATVFGGLNKIGVMFQKFVYLSMILATQFVGTSKQMRDSIA